MIILQLENTPEMLHLFFSFRVRENARTPAPTLWKGGAGLISRNGRQGWLNPNSTCFSALPQLDPSTQHSGELHWQTKTEVVVCGPQLLEWELRAALVKMHFPLQVYSKCTLEFENQCLVLKDTGSVIRSFWNYEKWSHSFKTWTWFPENKMSTIGPGS